MIRAMPERKRFFFIDVFPKDVHFTAIEGQYQCLFLLKTNFKIWWNLAFYCPSMTVMANGNGISQVKLDRSQSFYIIHTLAGSAITSAGMGSATKASFLGSIRQ